MTSSVFQKFVQLMCVGTTLAPVSVVQQLKSCQGLWSYHIQGLQALCRDQQTALMWLISTLPSNVWTSMAASLYHRFSAGGGFLAKQFARQRCYG